MPLKVCAFLACLQADDHQSYAKETSIASDRFAVYLDHVRSDIAPQEVVVVIVIVVALLFHSHDSPVYQLVSCAGAFLLYFTDAVVQHRLLQLV
jgi:hypothetical protein